MRSTHTTKRMLTLGGALLIAGSLIYGIIGPLDHEHQLVIMIVWIISAALLLAGYEGHNDDV